MEASGVTCSDSSIRALGLRADLLVAVDDDRIGGLVEGQRPAGRLAAALVDDRHRRAGDDIAFVGGRSRSGASPVVLRLCSRSVTASRRLRRVRARRPTASDTARSSRPSCRPAGRSCARRRCRSRAGGILVAESPSAVPIERTRSFFLSLSFLQRSSTWSRPARRRSGRPSCRRWRSTCALIGRLALPELRASRVGGASTRRRRSRASSAVTLTG